MVDFGMGLDLWFREDVARILASTQETMQASQAATLINEDYQQGFRDALRAVAVAFGVAQPSPAGPSPRAQIVDAECQDRYEAAAAWGRRNGSWR